jgi:hypothetical protein
MRAILTASFAALKPYAPLVVCLELMSSACVTREEEGGRYRKAQEGAGMGLWIEGTYFRIGDLIATVS